MKTQSVLSRAGRVEIQSDGKTVWVNDAVGMIGRFGFAGIDIHQPVREQMDKGECLFCTHSFTTKQDWETFKAKMLELYGVSVDDRHIPTRLREEK